MTKLQKICLTIACVMIVVCSGMLFKIARGYKVAENTYENVESTYVKKVEISESDMQAPAEPEEETVEEEEEVDPLARNYNRADFPDIEVDFDGLKAENPDTVAWLYIAGADISYPVVKYTDNEYYLHVGFDGEKSSSGCVFMDSDVNTDLTSWNTFFYGHNMKNGSMFGHLKDYVRNSKTYDNSPYIYVFMPDGIYRYEIFSYYLDQVDSKMYYTCETYKEYRAYLREATKKSVRECMAKCSDDTNIITCVTCSGSGSAKQRFFVHATFVDRYLYE